MWANSNENEALFAADQFPTVLVPGRRARRLLLRALIAQAPEGARCVQGPEVLLPSDVFGKFFQDADIYKNQTAAPDALAQLAWVQALENATENQTLWPGAPLPLNEAEALARARGLRQVCADLDSVGRTPEALARDECTSPEQSARWLAFAKVSARAHQRLAEWGTFDSIRAHRAALDAGKLRDDAPQSLLVLSVADIGPLLRDALRVLQDRVTIFVDAESTRADHFDDLGQPVPEFWSMPKSPVEEDSILVAADPIESAELLFDLLAQTGERSDCNGEGQLAADAVAIGLCDLAFGPAIERHFHRESVRMHVPQSGHLGNAQVASILDVLGQWLFARDEESLLAFGNVLRQPRILEALSNDQPSESPCAVELLDSWRAKNVGGSLRDCLRKNPQLAGLHVALESLLGLAASADCIDKLADALNHILGVIFAGDFASDDDDFAALNVIAKCVDDLKPAGLASLSMRQLLEILAETLASEPRPAPHEDNALEVRGWLDMAHEPANDIVLIAVNEGGELAQPRASAWLPDSARESLGLPCAASRGARDAHLLASLARRTTTLRAIVSHRNARGEPILPSRLLLHGDGAAMARRVIHTMSDDDESNAVPQPLNSNAPSVEAFAPPINCDEFPPLPTPKLSVTAFKQWIESPQLFYLRRELKLETLDPAPREFDPMIFGNLAHDALEILCSEELKCETDAALLEDALLAALDRRLGKLSVKLTAAMQLQRAALRERLRFAARAQAKSAQEGWRIALVEKKFRAELAIPGGDSQDEPPVLISGRIDRVDTHPDGRWRVLDYKTSNTAVKPSAACKRDGTWKDLQLPLYDFLFRAYLREKHGDVFAESACIELGYFSLAADAVGSGVSPATWSSDAIKSAIASAQAIVQAMRAGNYEGPPIPQLRSDDPLARILRQSTIEFGADDGGEADAETGGGNS